MKILVDHHVYTHGPGIVRMLSFENLAEKGRAEAVKQAEKLCESEAFDVLAEQHRGTALSIVAIIAGRGDAPDRAMVQCSKCGETFEFRGDGGWHLVEEVTARAPAHALEPKVAAIA
jgi:hypothetical protein